MVAAFSVSRQGPDSSSAARRNTAARSSHGRAAPLLPRRPGCRDGGLDLVGAALVDVGEDVAVIVGDHGLARRAGPHLGPADDARDVEALGAHVAQAPCEALPLGGPRRVGSDRLVDRARAGGRFRGRSWRRWYARRRGERQAGSVRSPGLGRRRAVARRGSRGLARASDSGPDAGREAPSHPLARRLVRVLRRRGRRSSTTSSSTSMELLAVPACARGRATPGAAGRGRHATGSWPRSRAARGRQRAAGTFCARNRLRDLRSLPPRRRRRRDRVVRRAGRRLQAPAARARGLDVAVSFSEDVRAELAAIEPRRGCCRLAELSALARHAGHAAPSGRGIGRAAPRSREPRGCPPRLRAAARHSGWAPRSAPTAGTHSAARPGSSCTSARTRGRSRPSTRQGCSTRAWLRSSSYHGGSSPGRAAAPRTCAGRSSRPAR